MAPYAESNLNTAFDPSNHYIPPLSLPTPALSRLRPLIPLFIAAASLLCYGAYVLFLACKRKRRSRKDRVAREREVQTRVATRTRPRTQTGLMSNSERAPGMSIVDSEGRRTDTDTDTELQLGMLQPPPVEPRVYSRDEEEEEAVAMLPAEIEEVLEGDVGMWTLEAARRELEGGREGRDEVERDWETRGGDPLVVLEERDVSEVLPAYDEIEEVPVYSAV